jgi:hypothetical protein
VQKITRNSHNTKVMETRRAHVLEATEALAGGPAGGRTWHGGTDYGGQLPGVAADVPKAGGSGCGACRWQRRAGGGV